jgi:hypothetical protein
MPVYPLSFNGGIMLIDGSGGQIQLQSMITLFIYHGALSSFSLCERNCALLPRAKVNIMASYHLTVKTGEKGCGASHASYISREDKYANKDKYEDLEHTQHGNMPSWAKDNPLLLWKAADEFERANGTTYREFEIALPRELTKEQRQDLVNEFIKNEIGEKHAYQYAIHCPKAGIEGKDQPHAHIMFCERINDGIERTPDQFFKRANTKNPALGGAKKANVSQSYTQRKEALTDLRSRWADVQNQHLEKHGHAVRVDHRSLKAQGIDREPERHFGPKRVRDLTVEQASTILESRVLERELERVSIVRDRLIDLSGDLHAALAERQEKSLQPQPVAESTPAPDIQDQLRAGMEAFRREFETRKEFMKGVETYKQEQERQREKERQERLRKELSRGHGNDRDQGYER